MAKFTNGGEGPRGINLKSGATLWAEPGQTIEIDDNQVADNGVHADFGAGESGGPKALDDHTVAELRGIADDEGIDLGDASKKADIVAAIELARETADEA